VSYDVASSFVCHAAMNVPACPDPATLMGEKEEEEKKRKKCKKCIQKGARRWWIGRDRER
jgi:hypothetical protein